MTKRAHTPTSIEYQGAVTEAARLRMEGTTAQAVTMGGVTKIDGAAAAGISRPTLDRWIARTTEGHTLTIAWDEDPDSVTLDGIRVDVTRRDAYLPAHSNPGARTNAGRATFLTLPEERGATLAGGALLDLHHTVIEPGGIATWDPAYLDAAVVFLVRREQARLAGRARDDAARSAALADLDAARAKSDALAGQGPAAWDALQAVKSLAQRYYDSGILDEDDARAYARSSLRR